MQQFVHCPNCQRRLHVPMNLAGVQVQCPGCGKAFVAHREEAAPAVFAPPMPRLGGELQQLGLETPPRPDEPSPYPDDTDDFGPRRDLTPHRGGMVWILGVLSVLFCLLGIILGPIAWAMANHDLHQMREGYMDPEGESSTNVGRICGIIGTLLNGVLLALMVLHVIVSGRL